MFNNLGDLFNFLNNLRFTDERVSDVHQPSGLYLTQSELQQVLDVMRENLRWLESRSKGYNSIARGYKEAGAMEDANTYYNKASKEKKRIKSLAAIQAKLKHSIITLG